MGTTGVKCIIIDQLGSVKAQAYKEYKIESPGPGLYELNPLLIWEAVREVVRTSVRNACQYGKNLAGISVSSLGEAVVLLDSNGQALGNSLLYVDSRGSKQLEMLISKLGEQYLVENTGLKPHIMYTLPKLIWIKDNKPHLYANIKSILTIGSYILYRLGSRPVIDYTLASRTMAFNVRKLCWDENIISAAEIENSLFPELAPPGTLLGPVDPLLSADLGLPRSTQLILGAHDQVCGALGAGISEERTASYNLGTVACICPVFSSEVNLKQISNNNFPLVPYLDGSYTTYAFSFSGGSLLKWFRDQFGQDEQKLAEENSCSFYEIMNEKASLQPTGIYALPHFTGSGTPHMDPLSRGALIGLSINTTRAEIYRCLMEGVTYEMRYNTECLEEAGVFIDRFKVCGGGARSDLWLQITADIMNREIIALDISEAGIMGAVALTAATIGPYSNYQQASQQLVTVKNHYYPDKENSILYDEYYRNYRKVYPALKTIFNKGATP